MTTTTPRTAAEPRPATGPRPLPAKAPVDLPESRRYRVKRKLLGPPLDTDRLEHERLGKPTALAVFASDNLSSSAYASEEILRVLVPVVGVAAFSLLVPLTGALLVVLGFLILSYRETIKAYPTAGGAYMVTRDNFGLLPAQVAGVALLTDYVLTVAVSVAAGTAALASAFPAVSAYEVPISVAFIVVIAFGNLKGVRESGRIFAVPTYFFMFMMALLIGAGVFQVITGGLPTAPQHAPGMMKFGSAGDGIFYGAAIFVILKAFASGGAAVTGVEAISNGVPAFKKPEWKNARSTLVIMGCSLGAMFLGLSVLAAQMKVAPYQDGTPTVISEVGRLTFGAGTGGTFLYYALQAATMLILVLAANTSFADFPRLASFHAGDNFMPKQLTKRGHRLVFSNGIIALSIAAIFLVIVTQAKVDRLIPLYAIGVFTSFTLSQAGMAKHHWTLREPHWRRGILINGIGAFLSFVVLIVVGITKFTHGAWAIIVIVPILVALLVRLNRQYVAEAHQLEDDAHAAVTAPILSRHVVLVFVARLDQSTARAIQYARTLMPDEMRAVHIAWDRHAAEELADRWRTLGLSRVPLELVDCPDRRVARAALDVVAREVSDAKTEVSVLLPHRLYRRFWHRLLHDNTGDEIATAVTKLEHANVTMVPFQMGEPVALVDPVSESPAFTLDALGRDGITPIGDVGWRTRARIRGCIRTMRIQPWADVASLECVVVDDTGGIVLVFLGRRKVAGVDLGREVIAEGMVGQSRGYLAILSPDIELLAP